MENSKIRTLVEVIELFQFLVQIYFEALIYSVSPIRFPSVIDYMTKGEGLNYYVSVLEENRPNQCPAVDSALKATSRVLNHFRRQSASFTMFTKPAPVDDFCFGIID